MKILHISTQDNGGAGLAALRIHKSLLDLGYDSKMLVASKTSQLDSVFVANANLNFYHWSSVWLFRKVQKHILRRFGYVTKIEKYESMINTIPWGNRTFFTFPVTHYDISEHPLVKEADIIHLHWSANFVDYETFFSRVKKPIIWTFHDENIGLGGFHYRSAKQMYGIYYKYVEEEFCKIKYQTLKEQSNITCIALSEMMAEFCRSKSFLKQNPIMIIHNGVDYNVYRPQNKLFARSVFNIPENDIVFTFCSLNLQDERKGLKELLLALDVLQISNMTLMCIGNGSIPSTSKINIVYIGQIQNENVMSLSFSCADLFIMPSFQEAFAQAPIEAMACGVPVVAFPCSGVKDFINDDNGVMCTDFTINALVDGIKKAMNKKYDSDIIRKDVINRFGLEKIANDYIAVYNHNLI